MDLQSYIRYYLAAARRRYALVIAAGVFTLVAVAVVVSLLPVKYQSTARILIEAQQIPSELARSTVTANASERVQVIQQRIMTRDNLLAVARKHKLYEGQPGLSPTDIVERMRAATKVTQIEAGAGRSAQWVR